MRGALGRLRIGERHHRRQVASLTPAGGAWPFSPTTVTAANVALSRMTVFNQLVTHQINVLHTADLDRLDNDERRPVALAGRISENIHGVIDDAKWYHRLKKAIEENINELEEMLGTIVLYDRRGEHAKKKAAKLACALCGTRRSCLTLLPPGGGGELGLLTHSSRSTRVPETGCNPLVSARHRAHVRVPDPSFTSPSPEVTTT